MFHFCCVPCPKNNLNLRIKTDPVSGGAVATVYARFLCQTYPVASAPSRTSPVLMRWFRLTLGQCALLSDTVANRGSKLLYVYPVFRVLCNLYVIWIHFCGVYLQSWARIFCFRVTASQVDLYCSVARLPAGLTPQGPKYRRGWPLSSNRTWEEGRFTHHGCHSRGKEDRNAVLGLWKTEMADNYSTWQPFPDGAARF